MHFLFRSFIAGILFFGMTALSWPPPKKVIFFGDSITAAGTGPGGYITKMKAALAQKGLQDQYELIGAGIGGNKVYDLYLRMEKDVLSLAPDVVVIYIGVNDVWHKRSFGTGTDPDKFVGFYEAILQKLQEKHISAILCTPATIGEKKDCVNEQDGDLNKYSQLIRDIAQRNHLPLVDLRKAFVQYDQEHNPDNKDRGILTLDGVHLNDTGNQMAMEMMMEKILALK